MKECWFVGAVVFYFQHRYNNDVHFLALVEVMKDHNASADDKTIPIVKMNRSLEQQQRDNPGQRPVQPKYAVINVEDIVHQVGLIQSVKAKRSDTVFKVIAPYYVFKDDMKSTAGNIGNL